MRAEAPISSNEAAQSIVNQGPSSVIEFRLGSPQAIDDLTQYFDNLRVNNLPVEVRYDQDPETSGSVRVFLPLPVKSIVKSIDLKTLQGIIVSISSDQS